MNASLHRLNRVLQAALLSISGHEPTETSPESVNADAEASNSHQPPGPSPPPPPEPRAEPTSHAPILTQLGVESGPAQSPEPNTLAIHVDSESQVEQRSALEPESFPTQAGAAVPATATATASAIATTTNPIATPPDQPTTTSTPTEPDADAVAVVAAEFDWAETREHEIARLESENAHLRTLLGIDSQSLSAAGVPDIDPEPPLATSSFRDTREPVAAGSSAWANAGAELANPFTLGFREDPSVLGLAATTPSRLHTLTPPNAPHAMLTPATATTATTATTASSSSTAGATGAAHNINNSNNNNSNTNSANSANAVASSIARGAGVFVSASWTPPAGGNDPGTAVGLGGPGTAGPQMQQQKAPPSPLGVTGLARTMELQGPGFGGAGAGVAGRGRGVLFGGRGRSVGW